MTEQIAIRKLNRATLSEMMSDAERASWEGKGFIFPEYDPAAVTPRILQIGASAFFRSHLAWYAHELLNEAHRRGEPLNWGIRAVSLRSTDMRDALARQNNLYSLTTRGKNIETHEIIGSITGVLCSRENTEEVLHAATDPAIT